jgi:hypothetical protein
LIILFLTAVIALTGCGLLVRGTEKGLTEVANSELFWRGRHGKLSEQEMKWAETAWKYFVNNYHPDTGLVNGIDESDIVSIWNIADIIAATVAARQLELIDNYEFDHRMTPLLEFLNRIPLSYGKMPDVFFAAGAGSAVDKNGNSYAEDQEESEGSGGKSGTGEKNSAIDESDRNADKVGWSAVDIGRLLVWLQILRSYAPQYAEYIDKAILRWDFCAVINECGELSGVNRNSSADPMSHSPKEPLGYYEYAMMGYSSWGFPSSSLAKSPSTKVYGIELPVSKEDFRETGISDPLVSLPYLLLGLEFNWDNVDDHRSSDAYSSHRALADLARRVYDVQEKRYQYERIFTARTDYRRKDPPHLIYDSIFADGYVWNTLTPEGDLHPDLALVSTSTAFGMWGLWNTLYTDGLIQLVGTLYDQERGWFEGRREKDGGYERTITCTTNAVILEVLYYKTHGKLYSSQQAKSYADIVMENEFRRPACSPLDLKECR